MSLPVTGQLKEGDLLLEVNGETLAQVTNDRYACTGYNIFIHITRPCIGWLGYNEAHLLLKIVS